MNKRHDIRIGELLHEAPNEWFVYLRPGWQMDGAHCFGEDTHSAVRETMKRVSTCDCTDCHAQMISDSVGDILAGRA